MLDSAPILSVIIPCRNEARHIEACLRSVLAQDPVNGGFEIIVADGLSDDGTREILRRMAAADDRIRMVDNPQRIVSPGLNAAIRLARGGIIVRMDAHTEYAPDYIRACVEALRASGADNVGGPWAARGSGLVSRTIATAFQSVFAVGGALGHRLDYEGPVDTVYLGCWPRASFEKFGLFDEAFVRNQDDEHNLTITRAGGRIWQSPRIRSWYTPRESLRALFRQYFQYGYWKVLVIRKHGIPASARHLVPGAFVVYATTGWAGCLVHPVAGWLHLGVMLLYAVVNLGFSLREAARHGWSQLPILPLVFVIYHSAYGSGFLLGMLDFVVLRRRARSSMRALTRPAAADQAPHPP